MIGMYRVGESGLGLIAQPKKIKATGGASIVAGRDGLVTSPTYNMQSEKLDRFRLFDHINESESYI